jgi:hypothetical protein
MEREEMRRDAEEMRERFGGIPSREMRRLMADEQREDPMARAERNTRMAPPVNATLDPIRSDAPTNMRRAASAGGLLESDFVAGGVSGAASGDFVTDEVEDAIDTAAVETLPRVDDGELESVLGGVGEDGSDDGPLDYDVPLMEDD